MVHRGCAQVPCPTGRYRCTRPDPPPLSNAFDLCHFENRLKSPGMECFRQDAATANSSASCGPAERQQPVDQAAGKCVPAADAVHDMRDVVMLAQQELVAGRGGTPTSRCASAEGFAQRDRDRSSRWETPSTFSARPDTCRIELPASARRHPTSLPAPSGNLLRWRRHVHMPDELAASPRRRLAPLPQILPIVEVARNGHSGRMGFFSRFQCQIGG